MAEATSEATPQVTASEGIVMIESLDQFVKLLQGWHANQVALLIHMKEIPEGTPLTLDDGQERILSGDLREGFLMGLSVALSELGDLPFVTPIEDVPEPSGIGQQLEQAVQEATPVTH